MKRSAARHEGESASQLISTRIAELGDWRGETLGRIRALIKEADPDILEGASLKDPSRLFTSSLDGNVRRAIDMHAGEEIDAPALKALIRAAVALNVSGKRR